MFNPYRHTKELDLPFSFERLYRHPGSLRHYCQGENRKRIVIIGGGIAGLVSAYELSQLNHQVTLLEANSRLGGSRSVESLYKTLHLGSESSGVRVASPEENR